MFEEFIPLPVVTLATGTSILQPLHALPERVTPESPAVDSMTDLRHASAVLVRAGDTVAHARERMRNRGVRMLFCVDISGHIEGLVTLNDMLGERPVQAAQQGGPQALHQHALLHTGGGHRFGNYQVGVLVGSEVVPPPA